MSPRTKEQFESIRSKSREKILDSALELFAAKGFHNTSVSQIATQARISKGLIYNYFDSKDDLLEQIIDGALSLLENLVIDGVNHKIDPKSQLRNIINSTFDSVESDIHFWKLLTSLSFQTEVISGHKDLISKKATHMMEIAEKLFMEMNYAEPKQEALLFGAILDGMFLHIIQSEGTYPSSLMKNFLLKKYCE